MNKRDLEKAAQRGDRAKQILNDQLVKDAFHDIRDHIYQLISSSSFEQSDKREDCYRMLRALESFEGMFRRHIQTGELSKESLKQKIVKRIQEL